VVNKADHDGADQLARMLRQLRSVAGHDAADRRWYAPILTAVATRGEGIPELLCALADHRAQLEDTGELARRRGRRMVVEIEAIALSRVRARFAHADGASAAQAAAAAVLAGDGDPYTAADELLALLALGDPPH
jgi:LAO/AO transport system kinase